MWNRCRNGGQGAKYYRDRGITVCERWQDFANFLADMGERPAGLTLDRKDNDRGYEPENCRWATAIEQRHNQRRVVTPQMVDNGTALSLIESALHKAVEA